MLTDWKRYAAEFDKMVTPPETLRPSLQASGAPSDFVGLTTTVAPGLARWATANCFLMRSRFNLVDLLDMLGMWTDERIDWALDGVLGETA